jgi:hypothetical protein
LAAAIAGAVLPLVPTTPFLLVATWAFANSSPKLHSWLVNHRRFGPIIRNWREHGAIPRSAKVTSMVLFVGVIGLSLALSVPLWIVGIQVVVCAASATFILTRPDGPRGPKPTEPQS